MGKGLVKIQVDHPAQDQYQRRLRNLNLTLKSLAVQDVPVLQGIPDVSIVEILLILRETVLIKLRRLPDRLQGINL